MTQPLRHGVLRPSRRAPLPLAILLLAAVTASATPAVPDRLAPGADALAAGRLQDAINFLRSVASADATNGPAQLLLCRAYFVEEQSDPAITACEAAVRALPRSSIAQNWLGRAYGRKADHASPLAGFKLAHKVRDAFEAAVRLDPLNPDAADDLGEYYINAPPVVGGGLDRADALATSLLRTLPQQSHRISGLSAEKRRDFPAAEREFRAAMDAAPTPATHAAAMVDLALYQQRRLDPEAAVSVIHSCLAADHDLGAPSVDAASILVDLHREPELARRVLTSYLAHGHKTDAAPAPAVYLLLSRISLAAGDRPRARLELTQALQLAPDFDSAKRALQGL